MRMEVPAELDESGQEFVNPGTNDGGGLGFSGVIAHVTTLAIHGHGRTKATSWLRCVQTQGNQRGGSRYKPGDYAPGGSS
ncbi:hypothetical protein GCM10010523_18370 [Paenarthrobacter ilicis]